MLVQAIAICSTNDYIRSKLIQITIKAINNIDRIFLYLKVKGWQKQSPMYPSQPANISEKICAGEAYFLWHHLSFRYDHVKETQLFYDYANDGDFKILLKNGVERILKKQTEVLKKEVKHFGIPIPTITANVVITPENTEMLEDDYMFRTLFNGIKDALSSHARILKQCSTNDRIINIFKDILLEEIYILDKLIKFGKIKSWFNPVPKYH